MHTRNKQGLLNKNIILLISLVIIFLFIPKTKLLGKNRNNFSFSLSGGISNSIPYYRSIELVGEYPFPSVKEYKTDYNYFIETLVHYNLNQKYRISSGLNYCRNSFKTTHLINNSTGEFANKYCQIPFFVQYSFTKRFSVTLGGYFGILLDIYDKTNEIYSFFLLDGSITYNSTRFKDLNNYGNLDLGLLAGLNYKVISINNFSFDIFSRINYGLLTHDMSSEYYDQYWKNINVFSGIRIQYK